MREDERDALDWLEEMGAYPANIDAVLKIKAMLAEPRLPETLPQGAVDAVAKAADVVIDAPRCGGTLGETIRRMHGALYAFLSAPRTKEVALEWWGVMRRDHTIDGVYACEANAKSHASGFGYTVVRLTGKATVPA